MLLQNENTIEIASNKLLSNREYENENNFTIEIQQTNRTNLQIYYGDTNIENYLKFF